MTPYEQRDSEFAEMIRREIAEVRARAEACRWHPSSTAWHRAFGELSGMHRILALIDPNPGIPTISDGARQK